MTDVPAIEDAPRPSCDEILQVVAELSHASIGELRGPRRMACITRPRMVACCLMYELREDLSFPQIGRLMGGRDHTTIMHAVKRVRQWLDTDPGVQDLYHKAKARMALDPAHDPIGPTRPIPFYFLEAL